MMRDFERAGKKLEIFRRLRLLVAAFVCAGVTGAISAPAEAAGEPVAIVGGTHHACALTKEGNVRCWGNNLDGQLGNGTTGSSINPLPSLVKNKDGSNLSGVKAVAAGYAHTCALMQNETVQCWGSNSNGQLGDKKLSGNKSGFPVLVKTAAGGNLTGVKAVAAGHSHTCALMQNKTVQCWGDNHDGELGNGTYDDSLSPVTVSYVAKLADLTGVKALDAKGYSYTCATMENATLRCWGGNWFWVLGDGAGVDRPYSVAVKGLYGSGYLNNVKSSTASYLATNCALIKDGTARCWGQNDAGQLGNGTTIDSAYPVVVKGSGGGFVLTGIKALTTGSKHSCALMQDGTARCWGGNSSGQLGIGVKDDNAHSLPVKVKAAGGSDLSNIVAIASGVGSVYALLGDGTIYGWGYNGSGQLGNGTTNDSASPVKVLW